MKYSAVTLLAYMMISSAAVSSRRLGETDDKNKVTKSGDVPARMELITTIASTAIRSTTEKGEHHFGERFDYEVELDTIATAFKTRMPGESRHLYEDVDSRRTLDELGSAQQQCLSDTGILKSNDVYLYMASESYINSMSVIPAGTPNIFDVIFSDNDGESLRLECANAGGYFDVNVGTLTCNLDGATTVVKGYSSCLADTWECRSKGNYEFLKWALETQGFTNCRTASQPQQPVWAPTPAPSWPRSSTSSPSWERPSYYTPVRDTSPGGTYDVYPISNDNSNSNNRPGTNQTNIFSGIGGGDNGVGSKKVLFYVGLSGAGLLLLVGLVMVFRGMCCKNRPLSKPEEETAKKQEPQVVEIY